MKRDMELVRAIMLRIEAKSDLNPEIISIEGRDDARGIAAHRDDGTGKSG